MRIGGPFPFGQGLAQVALAAGGIYYPPPGNYYVNLGTQTILQQWDGQAGAWRNMAQPSSFQVPLATDGFNWRLVNFSSIVQGALITAAGSAATANGIGVTATGVSVTFAAPAAGRTALAYPIVGGKINTTVTVTTAGSGFLVPPRIVFDPPPQGGIRATADAVLTAGGGISSITVTNPGAGYTTVPNVYIEPQPQFYQGQAAGSAGGTGPGAIPPPGLIDPTMVPPDRSQVYATNSTTGAKLTVNATLAGSLTLTGIGMLDYGSGYDGTHIPAVTITGITSATATAIMALCATSVTLGSGGAGYTGSVPIWMTGGGNVVTTAGYYKDGWMNTMIPRPARGTTTLSAGAVATFVIEDPGFAIQSVPSVAVLNAGSLSTGEATGTAVLGGIHDVSFLQLAVQ